MKKQLKKLNLGRLMDSCCVEIDKAYYDELFNYLIDTDVDLNYLNIDDLVVNGIQYLEFCEFNRDDYYILSEDNKGAFVI